MLLTIIKTDSFLCDLEGTVTGIWDKLERASPPNAHLNKPRNFPEFEGLRLFGYMTLTNLSANL